MNQVLTEKQFNVNSHRADGSQDEKLEIVVLVPLASSNNFKSNRKSTNIFLAFL